MWLSGEEGGNEFLAVTMVNNNIDGISPWIGWDDPEPYLLTDTGVIYQQSEPVLYQHTPDQFYTDWYAWEVAWEAEH